MKNGFESVDKYIEAQTSDTKTLLESIRKTIKETAPDAEECISYQMPAYKLKGPLVYFAAYKNHLRHNVPVRERCFGHTRGVRIGLLT